MPFIGTHPASLDEIKLASQDFIRTLEKTLEEIDEIEMTTIHQSKSKKWFEEREKRLTASNFHKVFVRRASTNPENLVKQILYTKASTKAMQFGIQMEKQAAERYVAKVNEPTDTLSLEPAGFRICREMPFLGASADGKLVNSAGDIVRLLEFKNPYSTWNLSMQEAALRLSCLKLDENNKPYLNRKDKYFTQVQGQMAVYGIHQCDFVLCTQSDIFVETVEFDKEFWGKLSKKLYNFYHTHLAVEIIYPRLKFGYTAIEFES